MSKIFQLEGGQYEHPNEYKLVSTVRGTTILQPEFGTVIIEGDVIEASTHNTIQKNGVLASKVNVTMESTDTVLVPTDMTIESDLFNELKIMLLFETGTTLPSNSFIKLKETNVPIANVNDYVVNANTPLLFLYFDSKFYAYKAGEGASTGAESLGDLSDVTLTTPTNGQTLVYNGTNFVNQTIMIQKNGVLSVSGIRQANATNQADATKDVYLVDIPGIDEFGTYDGMKLLIDFDQTNQTNLVYLLVNNTEYKINDVVLNELQTNNKYLCEMKNNIINIVINKQATETINGTSKIATQPEVDTGVEDTKIVTSKKLKERLDSLLAGVGTTFVKLTQLATESIAGIIKISTTAQVSAGTDNTTAVSPAKLSEAFANSKATNGYQKLPGGLIIQWGWANFSGTTGATGDVVTLPIAFPNAFLRITGTDGGLGANAIGITIIGKSQFRCWGRIVTSGAFADTGFHWIAIGY